MKYFFFGLPASDRDFLTERVGALHLHRLRIVVPLMALVCLIFLGVDLYLLADTGGEVLIQVYLGLDLGFLAFHLVCAVWLYQRKRIVPLAVVYGYTIVGLAWAVVTGAIEFQRTDNFTALFIAIFAVSALGLFSATGVAALIVAALGSYLVVNSIWPGFTPPGLERNVSLLALACVAFAISRTLYSAVINHLLATRRLEQANDELKEARLNLIQQEKLASLGVLSAGIAHEINNPLAFIKSNFAALERNHASLKGDPALLAEDGAIFNETKEGFRRIGEVVQALGTFGRDLPPGELAPYNLNEGIRTTLTLARHETVSGIVVETDLGAVPEIPARGSEINQILLNLLLNAFQAVRTLPTGSPRRVTVRTRFESGLVVADIGNNGPPVASALRDKIFEPFFSTKAPGAGMGLGLSLSWHLAARHQGELVLLEGEPVTFRLRLPVTGAAQASTQSTK